MYEELKQEIRDVVKPNFRQQINGQNLQDVLIDMVDNYPAVSGSVEVGDLIAKSGSWDNAADWITNNSGSLVTSESLAPVVEDLKDEIAEMGDIYATTASVNTMSASFDERINNIITGSGVDLSGYATTASVNAATESVKEWVEDKHYLTEHQDISGLATTASVNSVSQSVRALSQSVANDFANLNIPDISGLATTASVNSLSSSLHQDIQNVEGNLSEYATTASVNSLSSSLHNELAEKASTASLAQLSESVANDFANLDMPDISGLATTSSVNSLSESVGTISASFDQRINSITGSTGDSFWRNGTGFRAIKNYDGDQAFSGDASGDYSLVMGYHNLASGEAAQAFGEGSTASGKYSHAEGYNVVASGTGSYASGWRTVSKGSGSHAEGGWTAASGNYSHAEGNGASAQGYASHAEGWNTFSDGSGSHAEGQASQATEVGAHAEGTSTIASNNSAHAEGHLSQAKGAFSHAEGDSTVASGSYSHAEGDHTEALGLRSHTEGYYTQAQGGNAHAEGTQTVAEGGSSHAEGHTTKALGEWSHAEGLGTLATNMAEHAQGQYNVTASGQIFSVGIGWYDQDRKNAFSIITGSEFTATTYVYGIGGYDGTNPVSGSNDLATVIHNIPEADLSIYATTASLNQLSESVAADISELATTTSVDTLSASFDQRINDITGSGGGGDYLPLAGGTLTGNLRVNASVGVGTAPGGTNCLVVGSSGTEANSAHNSVVVGEDCHASVWNAFAAGRENSVVENGAFGSVTGFRNRVDAMAAYAGGCRSTGSGEFATAIGFGAEANSKGQVVLGSYNELDPTGNRTSTGSYAVIFGIGKSSTWNQDDPGTVTRQNGLAIKWNGDIDINYSGSVVALQAKIAELEARIATLESRQ